MSHTPCVTTVKMYLCKKVMTHPSIATNIMILHGLVSGMFANSVIFLDGTNWQSSMDKNIKVVLRDEMEFIQLLPNKAQEHMCKD